MFTGAGIPQRLCPDLVLRCCGCWWAQGSCFFSGRKDGVQISVTIQYRDRLGGGFKYRLFSTRTLGKWSNWTSIFFFKWAEATIFPFPRWPSLKNGCVKSPTGWPFDRQTARTTGNPGDWGGNSWVTNWSRIEKRKENWEMKVVLDDSWSFWMLFIWWMVYICFVDVP